MGNNKKFWKISGEKMSREEALLVLFSIYIAKNAWVVAVLEQERGESH